MTDINIEENEACYTIDVNEDLSIWTNENDGVYGVQLDPRPSCGLVSFDEIPRFISALLLLYEMREKAKDKLDKYYSTEESVST